MAGNGKTIKVTFDGDEKPLAQAADKAEKQISRFAKGFDQVKGAVTTAAAGVGLAAGAAVLGGIASGLEASKVQATLAAQLGATGSFAQDIGKVAGDLYGRGVVASMEEAAAAVKAVWQNNLVSDDASNAQIEATAAKVSTLTTVLEADAGRVSNAVSQMLRTGVAKSADEAFDILARGAQLGADKAGDLLDTFNEYGTQFRKLGLEGPQALGLINQAIKAGARDSDIAADALKEFSIRAIDGSKTTSEGFKALGLDAKSMASQIAAGGDTAAAGLDKTLDKLRAIEDPVKRGEIAVQLFGTQAEDLGDALFAMDPSKATQGLGDLAGAADKAGKTLEQSAGAKLESFKRKAQAALVEQLAKAIPYIEKTFGWLSKNSDWVTPLATALGILAVAIGVIVAVQAAWNAVLALSPVTWIILGIVALIAGIVLLATKTKFFQTIWAGVWAFFKAIGAWFAGPFAGFFKAVWNGIVAGAQWVWRMVSAYFGFWYGLFQKIKGWLGAAKDWMVNKLVQLVGFIASLPGKVRQAAAGLWNGIKDSFKAAVNWLIDRWNNLSLTIGGGSVLGVDIPSVTLNTPNIPRLAGGGWMTPGRTYLTGENGPELLTAGRQGGFVHSAGDTAAMGTPEVRVFIGERELTDIVRVELVGHDRQLRRRVTAGARA